MNRNKAKISVLWITAFSTVVLGLAPINMANAAAGGDDMRVINCLKGDVSARIKGFGNFILDQVSFDGLIGDIVDPWQDAIFTNECHAYDLFALVDRRDQLESAIRNSYLTCKFSDLEVQQKMYNRTIAEIYYVRNIINRYKYFSLPSFVKKDAYDEAVAMNPADFSLKIKDAFMKKFKKRFLDDKGKPDQKQLDQLFFDLTGKYAKRAPTYIVCPENPLRKVWEKIKEFKAYFVDGGLGEKLKDTWKTTVGTSVKNIITYGKLFASPAAWLSHISIDVNDVDIVGLISEDQSIVDATEEELKKKFGEESFQIESQLKPFTDDKKDNGAPTNSRFSELLNTVDANQKMANFMAKSGARSEVEYLFSDANGMVFIDELNRMDQAIVDSYAALDAVNSCSDKVNED